MVLRTTLLVAALGTAVLPLTVGRNGGAGAALAAQAPEASQDTVPAPSVRCPEAECHRAGVEWVVTTCADSVYASYVARPGADACLPTSLPGVGAMPGARGSRPVVCAGKERGYAVVRDRVGDRDRCERGHGRRTAPPVARAAAPRSAE